jgi:hypothetical protein
VCLCLCPCVSAAQSAHTPSAHTPKRTQQQGGLFTRGEMESVVGADNVDKSLVSSLINAVVCVHTQGSLDTLFGKTNSSASTSVNTSLSSFPATPGGASSGMRTPMSAHTPHSAAHTPHSTVHTPMSAHTPKSPSSRRVLTNNNSRKESHSLVFVDSDNDNDSFISNNNDGVSAASIISLSSVSMSTDSPHSHTHNNRPPPQQRTTKNQPPTPTQSATHTRRIMQSTDCLITLPDTLRLTTSKAWRLSGSMGKSCGMPTSWRRVWMLFCVGWRTRRSRYVCLRRLCVCVSACVGNNVCVLCKIAGWNPCSVMY